MLLIYVARRGAADSFFESGGGLMTAFHPQSGPSAVHCGPRAVRNCGAFPHNGALRMVKKIVLSVCLAAGAAAVACSGSGPAGSPTTPSGAGSPLNPDGSNLKIAAPTLNAPANGATFPGIFQDQVATLTTNNVTGTYTTFPVTLEFEVRNPANAVVSNPKVAAAGGATTSTTIPNSVLAGDTTYSWRVRATYNNAVGPWSGSRTFRTALAAGCSGQTCIDPLT